MLREGGSRLPQDGEAVADDFPALAVDERARLFFPTGRIVGTLQLDRDGSLGHVAGHARAIDRQAPAKRVRSLALADVHLMAADGVAGDQRLELRPREFQ